MKIIVVGGTTPLGQRLVRALCATLAVAEGDAPVADEQIVSVDAVRAGTAPSRLFVDDRLGYAIGDAAMPSWLAHVMGADTTSVIVLAAGLARDDADDELRATVDATRALLEACRARIGRAAGLMAPLGAPPRPAPRFVLVFAQRPDADSTSVQVQRARRVAIARLLVADYADCGHVDGRIVELPSLVDATASGDEPLRTDIGAWLGWALCESVAGRDVVCPNDTVPWSLVSAQAAVRAIIDAHAQPAADWSCIETRGRRVSGVRATAFGWIEAMRAATPADVAARWSVAGDAAAAGDRVGELLQSDRRGNIDTLPGDADLSALVRTTFEDATRDDDGSTRKPAP